ncbi:MAG: hypothetical protein KDD61_06900 [Bdellovibrionales bacterium]|nr:hypothetical protein [Bdellovibrionales bacterium]
MKDKNNPKKNGLVFVAMGFELVFLVLGGQLLGEMLDKKYKLGGLGQGGVIILMMFGWFYHLLILLKPFMEDDKSEDP